MEGNKNFQLPSRIKMYVCRCSAETEPVSDEVRGGQVSLYPPSFVVKWESTSQIKQYSNEQGKGGESYRPFLRLWQCSAVPVCPTSLGGQFEGACRDKDSPSVSVHLFLPIPAGVRLATNHTPCLACSHLISCPSDMHRQFDSVYVCLSAHCQIAYRIQRQICKEWANNR